MLFELLIRRIRLSEKKKTLGYRIFEISFLGNKRCSFEDDGRLKSMEGLLRKKDENSCETIIEQLATKWVFYS